MLDPQPPIAGRLFQKVMRDFHEVVFDAEAPGEAEIKIPRQGNRCFFAQIGQGHIGEQAQRLPTNVVSQMIAATDQRRDGLVPSGDGTTTHHNGRRALQRLDEPEQGGRTIHAAVLLESGTEIRNLKRVTVRKRDSRRQDVGIGQIRLARRACRGRWRTDDGEMAAFRVQEPSENRRTVRPGEAHPFDGPSCIDEGGGMTIANERVGIHGLTLGHFAAEVNER